MEENVEVLECEYCYKYPAVDEYGSYYSCEKLNELESEYYGCYYSIDNEVIREDCKCYLCDTCGYKEEILKLEEKLRKGEKYENRKSTIDKCSKI